MKARSIWNFKFTGRLSLTELSVIECWFILEICTHFIIIQMKGLTMKWKALPAVGPGDKETVIPVKS